ncbi:MAG: DNA mismatch repair endonuclease MutL [Lawsonibacter sp.]|nr:DNA mismatch repair endonuclease MutL [Lawsonibacter sp.]
MPNIQVLDPHVADLIAAGEVVERPASVAKELVENAIDAGASAVTVEIQHGGLTFLRVTDDGQGIPAEELPTAFLRHATSKLRREQDLEAIGTLGFRGEALAAIAAVSRVEIISRPAGAELGASLSLEGGVPGTTEDAGCPLGTTLVVRDLFFNTPARLKFMKKDAAEGAAVFAAVQRAALSHPEVSVKFIRDGKQELLTPGDGQLQSAVYAVLGRELALGFRPVKAAGADMAVSGFVSMPACCRGSRNYQFFFVNGRQIKSRLMMAALEEAYKNQKMVGKFPGCVLHLETRRNAVDVNVHPAKTEVKFTNERAVFSAVYQAVLAALEADRSHPAAALENTRIPGVQGEDTVTKHQIRIPTAPVPRRPAVGRGPGALPSDVPTTLPVHDSARPALAPILPQRQLSLSGEDAGQSETRGGSKAPLAKGLRPQGGGDCISPQAKCAEQTEHMEKCDRSYASAPLKHNPQTAASPLPAPHPLCRSATSPPDKESRPLPKEYSLCGETEEKAQPSWRLAGEVLNTYLVVEQGDTVLLIDKHAAHERMNFDRMKAAGYDPMAQTLLAPVVCRMAAEEREALLARRPLLEEFGFDVDELGDALAVRQAPFDVTVEEIPAALEEIAQKLLLTGGADPAAARDEILHTMACKAAIKGGWRSSPQELERVAQAVLSGQVRYCPHGRPVAIQLTRRELEKQFKRT